MLEHIIHGSIAYVFKSIMMVRLGQVLCLVATISLATESIG